MINGRVGSAFQDAGVQLATHEEGEEIIVDDGSGTRDLDDSGSGTRDVDDGSGTRDDGSGARDLDESGSGTRDDLGSGSRDDLGSGSRDLDASGSGTRNSDSFESPLEENDVPDLLPENDNSPLQLNDPSPSSSLQDTLDTIDKLDDIRQPRAGGADPPGPLDLEL